MLDALLFYLMDVYRDSNMKYLIVKVINMQYFVRLVNQIIFYLVENVLKLVQRQIQIPQEFVILLQLEQRLMKWLHTKLEISSQKNAILALQIVLVVINNLLSVQTEKPLSKHYVECVLQDML